MDVIAETDDNLTLVLTRIIEFTRLRHQFLVDNLLNCRQEGYVPRDLPLDEFTRCMTIAVSEHLQSERLLFLDSGHVRFRHNGRFEMDPVEDEQGLRLLQKDRPAYEQFQRKKLAENRMNLNMAQTLLMRKRKRAALKTEKAAN